MEPLAVLFTFTGFCIALCVGIPKWLRPRFDDVAEGLVAQLDQKCQALKRVRSARTATKAEIGERIVDLLDVASKLHMGLDIHICSMFYLIAAFLSLIASGIILVTSYGPITNSVRLSVLEAGVYCFAFSALFLFSVGSWYAVHLAWRLKKT